MFYSETLLSKTGPLARVWLSANIERKLSKTHILQSNIETSVNAIVDQGQAPLALRLSGQLLLGVVRIYSRKARYLLDDCNEAIVKIKMAFKPGNVDLPTNQSNSANLANLVLPDVLTELDLLAPMPDSSLLLPHSLSGALDPSLLDFGSSQRLSSSIEKGRRASAEPMQIDDTDLGLDLDLDLDIGDSTLTPSRRGKDIERGRDASARSMADEMDDTYQLEDLGLDLGNSELPPAMGDMDNFAADDDTIMPGSKIAGQDNARSSVVRDVEQTNPLDADESVHQAQRVRKRKVLQADQDTEIHSSQIRALQNDRSKILKPASFLPKDPVLLALMNMQRNGTLLSTILGDGRNQGLAPELRGIMSLEVVSRSADLKRKRDDGDGQTPSKSRQPRIQIDADDELDLPGGALALDGDTTLDAGAAFLGSDGMQLPVDGDGEQDDYPDYEHPNFDETTMPLVHPIDSGPVSLGTKHAVHLLRDKFGAEAAHSPTKRQKSSVLFQELLPERNTTRADATKMFFEVLVLATKDAIKVEQASNELGGPLRVRGKRGLWGAWAETGTEQTASQDPAVTEERAATAA